MADFDDTASKWISSLSLHDKPVATNNRWTSYAGKTQADAQKENRNQNTNSNRQQSRLSSMLKTTNDRMKMWQSKCSQRFLTCRPTNCEGNQLINHFGYHEKHHLFDRHDGTTSQIFARLSRCVHGFQLFNFMLWKRPLVP